MKDKGKRREVAIASRPSGVTQNQLAKFQEIAVDIRRRLQVKARSQMKNKVKGMPKKIGESCVKNRDANDFKEGNSSWTRRKGGKEKPTCRYQHSSEKAAFVCDCCNTI